MVSSKVMKAALAVGSVVAISVSAFAAQPAPATGEQKAKQNRTRMECRSVVQSGTRLSTRTCRPAHEWEDNARAAQDDAFRQQNGNRDIPMRDGNAGGLGGVGQGPKQ